MVFITAGMGGGTGTGAAPVIARMARERGMLTVGVVTKPFTFEGSRRARAAEEGIEELQQYVDTLIVIPNQNLFRLANERTGWKEAFKMADNVLYMGVRGVTDLMVAPGLVNLDFADIRTVMAEMGKAMMGTGEADGENRAIRAAEAAISNPLLEDTSMAGARGLLINITGGEDMTLFEVDQAANRIREEVDEDANIIFGSAIDDGPDGRMRVSVVATGIDTPAQAAAPRARAAAPGGGRRRRRPADAARRRRCAPVARCASAAEPPALAIAPQPAPLRPVPAAPLMPQAGCRRPMAAAGAGGIGQAAPPAARRWPPAPRSTPFAAPAPPGAGGRAAPRARPCRAGAGCRRRRSLFSKVTGAMRAGRAAACRAAAGARQPSRPAAAPEPARARCAPTAQARRWDSTSPPSCAASRRDRRLLAPPRDAAWSIATGTQYSAIMIDFPAPGAETTHSLHSARTHAASSAPPCLRTGSATGRMDWNADRFALRRDGRRQRTLKAAIGCVGVGLHCGQRVALTLRPAAPEPASCSAASISASTSPPASTSGGHPALAPCSALPDDREHRIGTVEHVMAALAGCGVDNAVVELDGPEVPILDGSAAPFVFLIDCAGDRDAGRAAPADRGAAAGARRGRRGVRRIAPAPARWRLLDSRSRSISRPPRSAGRRCRCRCCRTRSAARWRGAHLRARRGGGARCGPRVWRAAAAWTTRWWWTARAC